MASYENIVPDTTNDTNFQLASDSSVYSYNTNQINFYNNINSLITKNPLYNDTLTTIKWNTYYYKKYKAENNLLYVINIVCLLIIVINILKNKFIFFDNKSYSVIIGIILGYLVIHILYNLWSIMYKDELNFDENDHMFNDNHAVGLGINGRATSDSTTNSCSTTTPTIPNVSSEAITTYLDTNI